MGVKTLPLAVVMVLGFQGTGMSVDLVPGTSSTYTNGTFIWAGSPGCYDAGMLLSPQSPAIDQGAFIEGEHCPTAGGFPDGGCVEWYGKAPDIGACEYVPAIIVPPKPDFPVVLNSTLNQPPEEKTVTFNADKPSGAVTAVITLNVNDGEQCDEGKLYINGNGPVQLWRDDPTYAPDAADPCYMTPRNNVDATATFRTDANWWSNGENQVRFVHDKVSSSGFVVNSMSVAFEGAPPATVPKSPSNFTVKVGQRVQ